MNNIILEISYVGSAFSGWQKQKGKVTVQQTLEEALANIFGENITLAGSGRTDAGVSALKQVANFKINSFTTTPEKLKNRMNAMLPDTVKILGVKLAAEDFHARFSAKQKTYAYHFYFSPVLIPYYGAVATNFKQKVDLKKLEQNLQQVVGTHDFTSLTASGTEVENKVRTISQVNLIQNGNLYTLTVTADGFLYHMMRNLVGTLVDIASGKITQSMSEILTLQDRTRAGFTAPAQGLVLVDVVYEDKN